MSISNFFNYQPTSRILLIVLIKLALLQPLISSQQIIEVTPETRIGQCQYYYDSESRYTCRLSNLFMMNPEDILEIVGDHLPEHSNSDVRVLINGNSRINTFNREFLRIFRNVQFLIMNQAGISTITPDAFTECSNLRELLIRNNPIVDLTENLLANCVNLRVFDVLGSRVREFPGNIFGATKNLEVFNAERNELTSIPEDIFQNMVNLRVLNLGRNFISDLSPNLLRNSRNLEEFYIFSNVDLQDHQIVINVINGQSNLRRLSLSSSFINFDLYFLSQFQRLEQFDIRTLQPFTDIAWNSLPRSLKYLSIDNVGEDLPENAFHGLSNLTNLFLSGIGIETLYPNSFVSLTKLEHLTIVRTRVRILHSQQFSSQGNLHSLMVAWSEIEELPEGIFVPLANLGAAHRLLGISFFNNKIKKLNSNIFGTHPLLGEVNFSMNEIDKIERGTFNSQRLPSLEYLGLFFNRCVSWLFVNETNLDENENLEWCYNNWEGITTTEPNSVGKNCNKFDLMGLIFIGLLVLYIKY